MANQNAGNSNTLPPSPTLPYATPLVITSTLNAGVNSMYSGAAYGLIASMYIVPNAYQNQRKIKPRNPFDFSGSTRASLGHAARTFGLCMVGFPVVFGTAEIVDIYLNNVSPFQGGPTVRFAACSFLTTASLVSVMNTPRNGAMAGAMAAVLLPVVRSLEQISLLS